MVQGPVGDCSEKGAALAISTVMSACNSRGFGVCGILFWDIISVFKETSGSKGMTAQYNVAVGGGW